MSEPYSKEQLTSEVVEQELRAQESDSDYAHMLDQKVNELSDYNAFETIAKLKIDKQTCAAEIIKFGEMCSMMKGAGFLEIEYGSGLVRKRLKPYEERVADVVSSEVYRRQGVNRKWKEENEHPVAQVVDGPHRENMQHP
jgi:hypothetical protein